MNLSQLYDLRNYWTSNSNKVVTKSVAMELLDSHISALGGQDDSSIIQQSNEPVEGTQRVRESTLDHMAHRKMAQQVMRDYQAGLNKRQA